MNEHETTAWRTLIVLGAKETEIGGKKALDLSAIRTRTDRQMREFCLAFNEVAGRSGTNRRHVDRGGCPVFVVTDDA